MVDLIALSSLLVVFNYPIRPTKMRASCYKNWLLLTGRVIPCPVCSCTYVALFGACIEKEHWRNRNTLARAWCVFLSRFLQIVHRQYGGKYPSSELCLLLLSGGYEKVRGTIERWRAGQPKRACRVSLATDDAEHYRNHLTLKCLPEDASVDAANVDMNSEQGFQTSVWGPMLWTTIHYVASGFPKRRASARVASQYSEWVRLLGCVLPCGSCRKNFAHHRLNHFCSERSTFVKACRSLHRNVNVDLGKKACCPRKRLRLEKAPRVTFTILPR